MADNARGIHVSPGIYTREIDMTYAVRSLGITTLGLVGETQRGPAFQAMDISNWREFQEMFGGTSTEKFKGSQYPKYELPYIAKSYLSESEQLKVVRVLGLTLIISGVKNIQQAYISRQMMFKRFFQRSGVRTYAPGRSNTNRCAVSRGACPFRQRSRPWGTSPPPLSRHLPGGSPPEEHE